jgi:Tol biopolymer transport system component
MLAWTLPDGSLYAAPYTLGAHRLGGPGRPVGGSVLSVLGFTPAVTISAGGLAYTPTRPRSLVRVQRNGIATTLLGTDRTYHSPRISPDGRRIALDFTEQQRDVWLFDIADSTLTRFGFDSTGHDPLWLPDGSGLLFAAVRGASIGVFRRRFDGGARAESVVVHGQQITIHTITRDGKTGVAVSVTSGAFDLFTVHLDAPVRLDTLLASRYNEGWPALSPDGRWLAYASDESGRYEVYLRAWPGMGDKLQVSQNGGGEPMWSREGRELFYRSGGGPEPRMVAAAVEAGPMPRIRWRQELFSVASYEFATPHQNYDVFPDGRSFVMVRQGRPGQLSEVVYLQDLRGLMARQGEAP